MRELVDPRHIWRREDEDFSPWLADNLNLLDAILCMKLQFIELEKSIGKFYADIFCLNTVDNSLVVIENQLIISDHEHLGKLLTYAAGSQAKTVIWLATDFEREHRNALEWLNDIAHERVQFFGIKLELNPIDNLSCVPKFTLIAEPRNRNHSQKTDSNDWREQFFNKFRAHLDKNNSSLEPQGWHPDRPNYLGFNIGKERDIWLAAYIHSTDKQQWIAANLHMKHQCAESHFDVLKKDESNINRKFENKLQWNRHPRHLKDKPESKNIPQVGLYKHATDPMNDDDWPDQFNWLRETLEKLDSVFREELTKL